MRTDHPIEQTPAVHHSEGRTYFNKMTERRFYFIMTLVMMAAGILYELGVF